MVYMNSKYFEDYKRPSISVGELLHLIDPHMTIVITKDFNDELYHGTAKHVMVNDEGYASDLLELPVDGISTGECILYIDTGRNN